MNPAANTLAVVASSAANTAAAASGGVVARASRNRPKGDIETWLQVRQFDHEPWWTGGGANVAPPPEITL